MEWEIHCIIKTGYMKYIFLEGFSLLHEEFSEGKTNMGGVLLK